MNEENHKKYCEILEIPPDASLWEIKKSYRLLRELYSTESIVTLAAENEMPEGSREEILRQIEEAYSNLIQLFDPESHATDFDRSQRVVDEDVKKAISEIDHFTGPVLKEIREKIKIDLHAIALETKIRIQYLENIEAENFEHLPPAVYTRGFVIAYAKHLSLDFDRVARDFIARYLSWKEATEIKK
jgi:cytoskeletal protein RodZ